MTTDLSRLQTLQVRDVWRHEARDFTTWLLANADVLGDLLGMQLELTHAEHQVGGFSLDLIGRDLATDQVVIVENQLEQTDHTHLGQLMTYAGGTDPATVVWCAPTFREEHRAALDWLNERTDERTRFFGVEVSAVRIDDSRPAPLFRLIAKPNDWTKQVQESQSSALSGKGALYNQFWAELLDVLRKKHPGWSRATASSNASWITLPFGASVTWYGFSFTRVGPSVELYFGSNDPDVNRAYFDQFVAYRGEIVERTGQPVSFDPLPGKKACRIHCDLAGGGDIGDVGRHKEFREWFMGTFERFRTVTQSVKDHIERDQAAGLVKPVD
ncbi:MAG TPA: DUF4268 domain-containing protein [Propionicimonas sp.]|nr:DUF4268 domain-containing protein [Propionicimonas sp.]